MRNTGLDPDELRGGVDGIPVAVGVLADERQQYLICRRPPHVHQGGLWEFPGGKVEAGESVEHALAREFREEVGVEIERARPLIKIPHAYPDKRVLLDVWWISRWRGRVRPRENQAMRWVPQAALREYTFPAANHAILMAIGLPSLYLISPDPREHGFVERLRTCLQAGVSLLQLRAVGMPADELRACASSLLRLCHEHRAKMLINGRPDDALAIGADGVHLTSTRLLRLRERPLPLEYLVGASCHNANELHQAQRIGVDFVVISPVCATATHRDQQGMGWPQFEEFANSTQIPVYALGGMCPADLNLARRSGAQGVSMISGVWSASDPADAVRQTLGQ